MATFSEYNMRRKILVPFVAVFFAAIAVATFVSCGGTSGGDKDFSGTQFVADDSVGSIFFKTLPSTIQTSRTAPFLVDVRDGSGSPVPEIEISCDTEQGLALIEPTTGREITDNFGSMSGILGCASPGSFQIGCRLPIGANKRVFSRVTCTGEIPDGFVGFPGAGGGGLGGGQQSSDDAGPGGTSTEGFGILSKSLTDGLIEKSSSVDTNQVNNCGSEGDDTEPFGDAVVTIDFVNETNSTISCESYTITVPSIGTFGPISLGAAISGGVAPNGGEASVSVLLAAAQGDGTKTWAGSNTTILSSTGFKNTTFTFSCNKDTGDKADIGESLTISTSFGIGFSNVNRCTEGGGGSGGSSGSITGASLDFLDSGVASTSADVTATACGSESENIGDLTFTMGINNGTGGSVTVSSYNVTVAGVGSASTVSKTASLANGSGQTFTGTIALGTGTSKTTLGGTTITAVGNTSVTVLVTGTNSDGVTVSATATNTVNFTEVDNCS